MLSGLEPWLVGSVKESDCKVTDCSSYVQRVLTKSDGKVEKDTITLHEEKGEITYVDEGHDVEHVTAIHKNFFRHEIYKRNTRDKLRVKIGVRIIVAKNSMSELVKLVRVFEESTSNVFHYIMVSQPMTLSHDKLQRNALFPSLGKQIASCKLITRPFEEKVGHMERSMHLMPKQGVERQRLSQ